MLAARLNKRVQIQTVSSSKDTHGTEIQTYTTTNTVWAGIKPVSGNEKYINQQIVAEVTHSIIIRYLSGVTPKMRILFGTRVFDILNVLNLDEKNVEMNLLCRELV